MTSRLRPLHRPLPVASSSLWLLLLFLLPLMTTVINAQQDIVCDGEFEKCVMNRDCCKGLNCVAGDWAVTTDSHCLSERSEKLNKLTYEEKMMLLKDFYDNKAPPAKRKSTAQVHALLEKNNRMFAKLIQKIERYYKITLPLPGEEKQQEQEEKAEQEL